LKNLSLLYTKRDTYDYSVTEQGIFDKKQLKLAHFYKETITYFTYAEDMGIQPNYKASPKRYRTFEKTHQ